MIELYLTAQIIWMTNKTIMPCTFEVGYPHACYIVENDTIYISKEIKGISKTFALYHEIGHSLFKEDYPKDLFKAGFLSTATETNADNFAWWMYAKKYPKEKKFVKSILTTAKIQYFEDTCKTKCQKDILKIKVK